GALDLRLLLAEEVERPSEIGLDRADPVAVATERRRIDVVGAEPLPGLVAVEVDLRIELRARRRHLRLRRTYPGQRGGEVGAAGQRLADQAVELRIAEFAPPLFRNRRRQVARQAERVRGERLFALRRRRRRNAAGHEERHEQEEQRRPLHRAAFLRAAFFFATGRSGGRASTRPIMRVVSFSQVARSALEKSARATFRKSTTRLFSESASARPSGVRTRLTTRRSAVSRWRLSRPRFSSWSTSRVIAPASWHICRAMSAEVRAMSPYSSIRIVHCG